MNTLLESLDTSAEIWTAFWLAAIFSGLAVSFLCWLIYKIVDYFRTWFVWWDEDAGKVEIERRKVKGATIVVGKGKEGKAYFLNARARKSANKGSAYVIDVHSGMNLTGPSRSEVNALIEQHSKTLAPAVTPADATLGATDQAKAESARLEKMGKALIQKLKACDPFFAFNMLKTNSYKKFFRSQEGEEDWRAKVAPFALGALVVLGAVVIWLANAYTKSKGG